MGFNPCCCLTLRTGAIIIGILEIIVSSIGILTAIVGGLGWSSMSENDTRVMFEEMKKKDPELRDYSVDTIMSILAVALVILLVWSLIHLFMGSALIHGIKRQRPSFLKVWMIYEGCEIVAVTLLYIFMISTNLFPDLFTILLTCLLQIYFIYVVYRLHVEMREQSSHLPKPRYERT
ncbi:hypothetical protein Ocin01_11924 [Orchesella cincta]|uniref:Uncharacterized protein n=1 Tax=Orchesella cincta TaxID=48709 RepID=A0A1D2MPL5_ORCCI|nr:hypothetical protein Ocin01_11924 [Orchesella cincta]